jgi:ferric-dicitrate binding protein FerR (iron transport regulator)
MMKELLADLLDPDARGSVEAEALARARGNPAEADALKEALLFEESLSAALSPERGRFAERMHAVVIARARTGAAQSTLGTVSPWRFKVRILTGLAAALLIACGAMWISQSASDPQTALARISSCSAEILINGSRTQAAQALGAFVRRGDSVSTATGTAALVYPDGTQMRLKPDSAIRFSAGPSPALVPERKQLTLMYGGLSARVAKQPDGKSMLIATTKAMVEIVGTEFTLGCDGDSTRLEVTHGLVRLTRLSDGVALDVGAGKYAVARDGAELIAHAAGVLWSFDFEDGILPAVWTSGKVEAGPARTGNQFCLVGDTSLPWIKVQLSAKPDENLWVHENGIELNFDYWVDDGVETLDFYVWNTTQNGSFGFFFLSELQRRTWTHATVSIDGWRTEDHRLLKPGDKISELSIQPGQEGGLIYVDNVRITRSQTGRESK